MPDPWEPLLPAPVGDNEAKFHRVAWAMAATLLRAGPEALQVARVARRAGVSRAWIYKYLGSDADQRLAFAVRLYGRAFAAPTDAEPPPDRDSWCSAIAAGTRQGLDDVVAAPWCLAVYGRYRHAAGFLGTQLRELERAELRAFVDRMPPPLRRERDRAERFAWTFHAARLGVYHHWLDPAFRDRVPADDACAPLLGMVSAFARR